MITDASTHHERTFVEVKRLSSAGLEGTELLRQTAERLRLAVPFEGYGIGTLDPATNLMTHFVAEGLDERSLDETTSVYLDRVYFEEDLDRIISMLRERRPVELLSEAIGGKPESKLLYREFLKPLGFAHGLGSVLTDGGSAWGALALVRGADAPDFSSRDIGLVRRLTPHVGAGLKAAVLNSRASVEPATEDAPGVLALDHRGHVLSHTPSVEQLLSELEELDPFWRESRSLPVAVRMVRNAVRRALAPGTDRDLDLIPKMRVRARSGRWLTLYGSLTEASPGRPSETVIVVEPTKSEEVAWLNAASYGLSPREEEVVKLVVHGFSNRQISRTLHISENTVQRHLSNIFEKVGVRSRKELLKRLFFENLLPGMLDG
jgi:DNA-binding CsgD family transcriptional regulator